MNKPLIHLQKHLDVEPFAAKSCNSPGYNARTRFILIHLHPLAIEHARTRGEWESAPLSLWELEVPETQLTTVFTKSVLLMQIRHQSTRSERCPPPINVTHLIAIHDAKVLTIRFADLQSFNGDTNGGEQESNLHLVI